MKCEKFFKKEGSRLAIQLTNKIVVKIYPEGKRLDSSNLNPVKFWNHGFQIGKNLCDVNHLIIILFFVVALNFQKEDLPMVLNTALFNDNGQSGYILNVTFLG